jgi:cytochrome c553
MSKVPSSIPRLALLFQSLVVLFSGNIHGGWNGSDKLDESSAALQLEGDYERGRAIYENCGVCHMPEGWGTPNGAYPQIAGQHRRVVIKQLADIRALNRDNPSMYPFAIPEEIGGVQAIADVALYIENLKMTTATGKGSGEDLLHGETLYRDHCAECHGRWGEGKAEEAYPLIQGQHYLYLLRQLNWFQNGKRRNVNKQMARVIRDFDKRDFKALADYISRLAPSEDKRSPITWTERKRD